jgi:hypothetical protein
MSTPSPNDTVITPGVGYITDGSGDFFSITNAGTVNMNGSPLGYTANVIKAAYVNGNFWQENSSKLWWEYTGNPSSPWTGLGTSISPLPAGTTTPSPNDTLITPGTGSIIDSSGDVFKVTSGGTVDMNGKPLGYSANVIAGALVNGHFWQENSSYLWWEYTGNPSSPWAGLGIDTSPSNTFIMNGGTINLAHTTVTLQLGLNSSDQINLNGGVVLNLTGVTGPDINVNAPGAILHSAITIPEFLEGTINLATGTDLIFSGTMGETSAGPITISGNGTLINNGEISTSRALIDSNVLGIGTMEFTSTHDGGPGVAILAGASGAGQTYDLPDDAGVFMTVEHPDTFMSKVSLGDESAITLAGLAATSYDLRGDFLTLYQGNTPVYRLNVTDESGNGQPIYVGTTTAGVTVGVLPQGPYAQSFGLPSTYLPQHTAGV